MRRRRSKRSKPSEGRPSGHESVGFRRGRTKRLAAEAFLTGTPLLAGLDLGKDSHAVFLLGRDLVPRGRFTIAHSREGVDRLLKRAAAIQAKDGFDRLLVFMETTSHFWHNVANVLEENGVAYRTVAPLAVERQREVEHLTYAKGDFRDAQLIARLGAGGTWLGRTLESDALWLELAALTREHDALSRLSVRERVRIRAFLELALPELLEVFEDHLGLSARALLRAISNPPATTVAEVLERAEAVRGRRIHVTKLKRFVALLGSAKSFGVERELAATLTRVGLAVARFDLLRHQLTHVEERLLALYERTPYRACLDTIPAVGQLSHARFLGLVGDPRRYDRGTCLSKLAGIEPRENHSGREEGSHSISRRGLPRLRHLLFEILSGLRFKNPEFATYMERLQSREKNPLAYHQALVAGANKYLRLVHRMCVDEKPYDPRKVVSRSQGTHDVEQSHSLRQGKTP